MSISSDTEEPTSISRRNFLRRVAIAGAAGGSGMALGASVVPSAQAPPTTDVQESSYIVYVESGTVKARNGTTGVVDYSGTNAATVITNALGALSPGRAWKETVVLKGNFTITSKISLPSYTTLDIRGKLTLGNLVNDHVLEVKDDVGGLKTDVDIVGGVIDGNRGGQPSDSTGRGSGLNITGQSERVQVWGSRFTSTRQYGVSIFESHRNRLWGVVTDFCGWDGIAIEADNRDAFDNEVISASSSNNGAAQEGNNKAGIRLEGHSYRPIGTKIIGGQFRYGINGIAIIRGDRTEIHGAHVASNNEDGITIASSRGVKVIGGTVRDNGRDQARTGFRNGIRIDDSTGITEGSKQTVIDGVDLVLNPEYGIVERGPADNNIVIGCTFADNPLGAIWRDNSLNGTKIAHNIGTSTHIARLVTEVSFALEDVVFVELVTSCHSFGEIVRKPS